MNRFAISVLSVLIPTLVACGGDSSDGTADTRPGDTIEGPAETTETTETTEPPPDTTELPPDTTEPPPDTSEVADDVVPGPSATPICVAVRGNGELVTAHFSALARLAELYGPFEGVAGGSSGSITAFLTESMHMNPRLWRCGDGACDREQAGLRLALMYKSLYGYLGAMTERDEAVAIAAILEVVERAQAEGIGELIDGGQLEQAWTALVTLLESEDVRDLVNPELLGLLGSTEDIGYHLPDIWAGITSLGSFDAVDATIFVRPGLVHFAGLASKLGRIGSFYAGYGAFDEAGWEDFFTSCSDAALGLPWELAAAAVANGLSCHERFRGLLDPWRADFIPGEDEGANRIRDLVGANLRALVITSVLTGDAADAWEAAYASYLAAEEVVFAPDFADLAVGYWGAAADTAGAANNPLGYADLKTQKAMTLGQTTWLEALSASPAEPGLSRAVPIGALGVSVGGWPDLAPVLALKNAGCEHVVYLTRRGGESLFAQGVAQLLGMGPAEAAALFDLADESSSFSLSLREAAGVWCTDWNAFGAFDLAELVTDAYDAPFELHDPDLEALRAYDNSSESVGLPGCTPGIAPSPDR